MAQSLIASACLLILTGGIPNPVWLWWRCARGTEEMPKEVAARALRIAPLVPIIGHGLLIALLLYLFNRSDHHVQDLIASHRAQSSLMLGAFAGLAWLALYASLFAIVKPGTEALSNHDLVGNHPRYWAPATVMAPVSEELWRAFCFVQLGNELWFAGILTVGTAAIAHAPGKWRVSSAALFAAYAGCLFIFTSSMAVTICAHMVLNIGAVALVRGRWHRLSDRDSARA